MNRYDCLSILAPLITDEIVVTSITGTNVAWRRLSQHEGNISSGSLGTAAAVGTGMALALPRRRVIVMEGDGSALMDLSCLATIGRYQPQNLRVFVFDNKVYSGTRISQPSATAFRTRLEVMAKGAGIENAEVVTDLESFEKEARSAIQDGGLRYVVVKIEEDLEVRQHSLVDRVSRRRMDRLENKYRFMRYIESTEALAD